MGDLRDWLAEVERRGELKQIDGADWDLEIGYIQDRKVRGEDTSVLLFDNIKGYPSGYRLVTTALNTPGRTALTLNLPNGTKREVVETLRHRLPQWEASLHDFAPQRVETGPVLENVDSGENVDLLKFPAPKWHDLDGGRYIGTGCAVITSDPNTGQVNLGTYRIMVHDEKTAGLYISPGKHGRIHCEKYYAAGQPCPVAVSLGHHPLILAVAASSLRGSEYNWVGAIRGHPEAVIVEEVTGLPIPADSEIVLAGWCPPGKSRTEGPFGEWTGYYGSMERPAPIIEIERIYYRSNPIILGRPPQRPGAGVDIVFKPILDSAILHNELEKMGIPDVRGVWISESAMTPLIIISIKQRFAGHAKRAALIASQSSTLQIGRYIVVVDEDIDPTNIQDVIWSVCFRSDPAQDIDIVRNCRTTPLDPLHRPDTPLHTSVAIVDACKPYDRIEEFPPAIEVDSELARQFAEKWRDVFHAADE